MERTYRVELYKQAAYTAEVDVVADSPEDAKRVALEMDDLELDWDYSDPGGDIEAAAVVDYEEEEERFKEWSAQRQEELAKEVRVVAKPFQATRVNDGLAVGFGPGDALKNLSEHFLEGSLHIQFDSTHGRCTITNDEVLRQTGCGSYWAFPPQKTCCQQ